MIVIDRNQGGFWSLKAFNNAPDQGRRCEMTVKELIRELSKVKDQNRQIIFWTWKHDPYGAFVGWLQPTLRPENKKGFFMMSASPEYLLPEKVLTEAEKGKVIK
jgi:hypothetical protein